MPDFKPTVLLVEDNEEDVFLFQRAMKKHALDCQLQVAEDGQQAIEYLAGTGPYADREEHPFPSVVLVDLKLPCVHGFDVLAWISAHPACKKLKPIVLTSSGEDRDRDKVRSYGVDAYFVKPPSRDCLEAVNAALAAATQRTMR